ncbi:MAG: DUF1592 domain-containing protein [Myxococcales bacterium]|nr:DUF1592 domain-containing protein [Myxococcales bacterium]
MRPVRAVLGALLVLAGCDEAAPVTADAGAVDAGLAPLVDQPFVAPAPVLRRLTRAQYTNTVRDVLGDDVVVPRGLEPDVERHDLVAIGASEASVSRNGVEQYQSAAYDLAQQVFRTPARRARWVTCAPAAVRDDRCAETVLSSLGERLWRRPLDEAERARLVGVAGQAAAALNDFDRGLEYGLAALLQAPDMIFRVEVGDSDRLGPYALASKLSYFLWNGPPDPALLGAAAEGRLGTPEGLSAEVTRMLAAPAARRGVRAFVSDWLHLQRLDAVSRDATAFPAYGADLPGAAREETLRLFERLAFEDVDFRDFLTTRRSFLNRRLASIYRVAFPVPVSMATPETFAEVTFDESAPRRGLLGHASMMLMHAHPTSSSPTLRGRFIREDLLCSPMPMPPVNVNTAIPEPSPNLRTLRQRLAAHSTVDSCASCHRLMDPLGLSLESLDAIGRARLTDNGAPLDTRGDLDGRPFSDLRGLAEALRDAPLLPRCVVFKLYRYAHGREDGDGEFGEIVRLERQFLLSGYRFQTLVTALVTGDAFSRIGLTREGATP